MGDKHVVRFEPVGIEIEVDEDQTILRAAAEQGVTLMHGCKEGQCASCKSFVLDGEDPELDKYSTFALPDFELEEGYTLLCRAHVYEDVTIELLNYDEEMMRSGHPISEAVAEVVSNDAGHARHAAPRAQARRADGVRVLARPVHGHHDSRAPTPPARSRWPTPPARRAEQLEFVIKIYPDGQFSSFLDTKLAVGDRLDLAGPFGVFTLRDRDSDIVFVGGGAGMAPILCLLRALAERGSTRKATYYYGARTKQRPVLRGGAARPRGRAARTSRTCRPCPSRPRTTPGTARSA